MQEVAKRAVLKQSRYDAPFVETFIATGQTMLFLKYTYLRRVSRFHPMRWNQIPPSALWTLSKNSVLFERSLVAPHRKKEGRGHWSKSVMKMFALYVHGWLGIKGATGCKLQKFISCRANAMNDTVANGDV